MTGVPQFVDISAWQPEQIDWKTYRAWAAQWDGIARVSLRSSYGVGYTDQHYSRYLASARAAGVDVIIHYHYAYPSYNSAVAEADWQMQVIGLIHPQDWLMLDYEENVPQATAQWAYEWLLRQEQNYGGKLPTLYASDSYIRSRLQDSRLAHYPLTLANWKYDPNARPPCPPPWKSYVFLQFTDKATVPGIAGTVDANIYLGGASMGVPAGWHDDGKTLTAPNSVPVRYGFREYVLSHNWDANNWPLGPEFATGRLEDSNPSLGGGSQQIFRWSMLGYNTTRGVFFEWVGQELIVARQQVAKYYPAYQELPKVQGELEAANTHVGILQGQLEVAGKQIVSLQEQVAALEKQLQAIVGIPAEAVTSRMAAIEEKVTAGADVLTGIHQLAQAPFS